MPHRLLLPPPSLPPPAAATAGRTAGEVVGQRDPQGRHLSCPGLRNFSALNVLWNGLQRLWVAVPTGVRPDMERQGGVGGWVAGWLGGWVGGWA